MTPYYRILNRHGGFTWIQSCATVVCNSKNGDEQSIVCVNYVLSRTEMKNLVVDQCQIESASPAPSLIPIKSGGFKMMGSAAAASSSLPTPSSSSAADLLPGESPEESGGSEDGEPSPRHTKNESRPSSGEAEEGGAETAVGGIVRTRGQRQQTRPSSKRKYGDNVAGAADDQEGLLNHHHHHQADNLQHATEQSDQEEAARAWKRLYAGSIMEQNHNSESGMQDRDLDANGSATDFSADALISGKQRPTIQWIGGAAPTSPSPGTSNSATGASAGSSGAAAAAAAALSVPSLLRQLYASRESVIRANVHAAAAAAAAGRSAASGYHFSNGDGSPMGSGAVNGTAGVDYPSDVFPAGTSAYHSAAAAAAAAAGTFLPEYLPAMTPPSSVSPRDAAAGALFAASAEASLRHYGADQSYVATALKPHHHHHPVYGKKCPSHHLRNGLNISFDCRTRID